MTKLDVYQRDVVRHHLDHRSADKHRKFGLVSMCTTLLHGRGYHKFQAKCATKYLLRPRLTQGIEIAFEWEI